MSNFAALPFFHDLQIFTASASRHSRARPLVGILHAADEWIDIASMAEFYQITRSCIARRLIDPR